MSVNELLNRDRVVKVASTSRQYFEVGIMPRNELVLYSKIFGFATLRPSFMLQRRLQTHLAYIKRDDDFVSKHIEDLSHEELIECIDERGLPTSVTDIDDVRDCLKKWLEISTNIEPSVPGGLSIISSLISYVAALRINKQPELDKLMTESKSETDK
jgi:LETM1-like protein